MYIKKICCSLIIFFSAVVATQAQDTAHKAVPLYIQHPTIPAFKMLMAEDSVMSNASAIPKGKDIILIFFSPDCGHCQMLTDSVVAHMNELKHTRIYMCGVTDLWKIKEFGVNRKLGRFGNITMAKDVDFFFLGYYGATSFPFIAVYDKNKNLIKGFDGDMQIGDLVKAVKH